MEPTVLSVLGGAIALGIILAQLASKTMERFFERQDEKNGSGEVGTIKKISEILDRMDRREATDHEIISARDEEGRPKVWFPESMIKRTHEAVRNNLEATHELAKGLNDNTETLKEIKVFMQSHPR
jgi:hypothetical protein